MGQREKWPQMACVATLLLFLVFIAFHLQYAERLLKTALDVGSAERLAGVLLASASQAVGTVEHATHTPSLEARADAAAALSRLEAELIILDRSKDGQKLMHRAPPGFSAADAAGRIGAMRAALAGPASQPSAERLHLDLETLHALNASLWALHETATSGGHALVAQQLTAQAHTAGILIALLIVSGSGLVGILLLQWRADQKRLKALEAANATVRRMEANLHALVAATPAGMAVVDPTDFSVSFINPAAVAIVDSAPSHPDWSRLVKAAFQCAHSETGGWAPIRMTFSKLNGDVISLRGTFGHLDWEGRTKMLLVLVDVSRIRDADLKVLQAAKLATLGELATAIAHELNQPLAVMRMAVANAQRLLAAPSAPEAVAAKLERVNAQIDRAKRIIDQVRGYGRTPAAAGDHFGLRQAVDLAIGFVVEQYRTLGIRLMIDLDLPANLSVAGDQAMFEQIIVNLLVNARNAFESRCVRGERSVYLRARQEDGTARIEIEDDAGGITDEIMPGLFEPFSCATQRPKNGLGLPLARSLIRDMGGQISVQNVRAGACFTLILPIAERAQRRDAA